MKKAAAIDLDKLKDILEPRFVRVEIIRATGKQGDDDFDILEIHNLSLPRQIYVNSDGEIWTSTSDFQEASSVNDAVKQVRDMTASKAPSLYYSKASSIFEAYRKVRMVAATNFHIFKLAELRHIFSHCGCEVPCGEACGCPDMPMPTLMEAPVQEQGDEIVNDLLGEPEMTDLDLSPEDQGEVVVMVFDDVIASKEEQLNQADVYLATKTAAVMDRWFESLRFAHYEGDKIEVYYDNAGDLQFTAKSFIQFLRSASKGLDGKFKEFYKKAVHEFSERVSKSTPDYFLIRHNVMAEIAEQLKTAAEGPRGGNIIGKTKSGKPIYDEADHPAHREFSALDHQDASQAHTELADKHYHDKEKHDHHDLMAVKHSNAVGKASKLAAFKWEGDERHPYLKGYDKNDNELEGSLDLKNASGDCTWVVKGVFKDGTTHHLSSGHENSVDEAKKKIEKVFSSRGVQASSKPVVVQSHGTPFEVEIMDGTHLKMKMQGTDHWGIPLHFAQLHHDVVQQLHKQGLVTSDGRHFVYEGSK